MSSRAGGWLLLAALAACQPLPRPFEPDRQGGVKPLPPAPPALVGVVIEPVEGLTAAADARFRARLRAQLTERGVTATVAEAATGGYRLVSASFGELSPVPAVAWRLLGQGGEVVGEGAAPLPADPAAWEDERLERVLRPLADLVARQVGASEGAVPVPTVMVEGVTGASGDGNQALARALAQAFGDAALRLATAPGPETFAVRGDVRVAAPRGTTQEVEIAWSVLAPDGQRLGVVRQANRVPAGSLDVRWGATARAVALAAAEDIVDLLRQAMAPAR